MGAPCLPECFALVPACARTVLWLDLRTWLFSKGPQDAEGNDLQVLEATPHTWSHKARSQVERGRPGVPFIGVESGVLGFRGLTLLVNSTYKSGDAKLWKRKSKGPQGLVVEINQDLSAQEPPWRMQRFSGPVAGPGVLERAALLDVPALAISA